MSTRRVVISLLILTVAQVGFAAAPEVSVRVSARETYVGQPVQVQVIIRNAEDYEPPEFPDVDGATIRRLGDVQRSSQVSIINGRVTQEVSSILSYALTPTRAGTIEVPPISIRVEGKVQTVPGFAIIATRSETGDLLFVEVGAERESIYVGEPLPVVLRIWIRPYRDRRFHRKLSEGDMWDRIDLQNSQWGEFADPLQEMFNRRRRPRGEEVVREDSQGRSRAYYLYEIETTLWPERAGALDAAAVGDISILVSYPVRLERDRSIFSFGDLRIASTRPIVASARLDPVEVKPIPTEGRPPHYTGAVGRYRFAVTAKPTEVRVGDPITLTMTIQGTDRLDLLQAPPLARMPELTADFQVPDEPLAGTVSDGAKQFTQSIRAKNDAVTEIPPIPFACFDPQAEEFVVLYSDPIPITVKAAKRMAVSQIVEGPSRGAHSAPSAAPTPLTELGRGILANYTDMNEVLTPHEFRPGVASLGVALASPTLFALGWVVRRRGDRLREDAAYVRRRYARRNALRAIAAAERSSEVAPGLAAALTGYLADRCNLPGGGLTRVEAIDALKARQVRPDLIERTDTLLRACEDIRYAGACHGSVDNLAAQAKKCIAELERQRF